MTFITSRLMGDFEHVTCNLLHQNKGTSFSLGLCTIVSSIAGVLGSIGGGRALDLTGSSLQVS